VEIPLVIEGSGARSAQADLALLKAVCGELLISPESAIRHTQGVTAGAPSLPWNGTGRGVCGGEPL